MKRSTRRIRATAQSSTHEGRRYPDALHHSGTDRLARHQPASCGRFIIGPLKLTKTTSIKQRNYSIRREELDQASKQIEPRT